MLQTLSVERISVVVIACCELDQYIGRAGLNFVELECGRITPDAERSVEGATSVVVAQIRTEVANPGRTNERTAIDRLLGQ